jgi:GT2 family glycosyltransferase
MTPVIMLVRNSLELTKRAVASVLAQNVPVQLRVIDNGSDDSMFKWLQSQLPNLRFWTFRPGLGVSAGWNFALTDVFRRFDHAVVVNNDVVLRGDTVKALLADGGDFVTGVGIDQEEPIYHAWQKSIRPHPDFSLFLIRKHVWNTVGAFDESMKLYASDADYHVRMHTAGIKAYTIGLPFYHVASGTLKHALEVDRKEIEAQADRDRAVFEGKWGCKIGSPEYGEIFK